MKKLIDGVLINMTAKEISAKEANEAQAAINIQTRKDAQTQKENNKTSAQNKLKALGLTDAEIEAL
jgi:hypothetical protein